MINEDSNEVGVVGLGLMGCSIVAALLMRGYKVVALAPQDSDLRSAPGRITHALGESFKQGIHRRDVKTLESNVLYTRDYADREIVFLSQNVLLKMSTLKKLSTA